MIEALRSSSNRSFHQPIILTLAQFGDNRERTRIFAIASRLWRHAKRKPLLSGRHFQSSRVLVVVLFRSQDRQVPPAAVSHRFFSSSAMLRLLFSGKPLALSDFPLPCKFLSSPTLPAVPLLAPLTLPAAPFMCSR